MRLAAAALALVAALSACSGAARDGVPPEAGASPSATAAPAPSDTGVREEIEALLASRARAVETGRRTAFAATATEAGRAGQLRDYDVLQRFPVASVAYRLGMHDPSVSGDRYSADVEMLVRLDGFDAKAVPVEHRLDFVRTDDGWRVERETIDRSQVGFAPWLMKGLELYASDDVLIAFDQGSVVHRERFARIAEEALDRIVADVPVDWIESVVILAPSRTGTLRYEGFDPVEIGNLGGVAYPVRGPDQQISGRRVVIAPAMLAADDRALSTILRHELAHVALVQPRDERVPTWVSEGVAEYAAHQGDTTFYIARSAVDAAEAGIEQMPPDGLFHRGEWGTSYGISWWAMQWLAREHGPSEPYDLLADLRRAAPADFREVSTFLEKRYGLTTDQLAARAGELIDATFD